MRNIEKGREYAKKYYHEHREAFLLRSAKYRKQHPELTAFWGRNYIYNLRQKVIMALGNRCIRCGFEDIRALQVDHIDGNGGQERRMVRSGVMYRKIIANPNSGEYQLLCANCNWIKRCEEKEYVRKDKRSKECLLPQRRSWCRHIREEAIEAETKSKNCYA